MTAASVEHANALRAGPSNTYRPVENIFLSFFSYNFSEHLYNFLWNIKSKKVKIIFFFNYEMRNLRIFQYSHVWKVLREDVDFLNISEKCSNSYKNYVKNFNQGCFREKYDKIWKISHNYGIVLRSYKFFYFSLEKI